MRSSARGLKVNEPSPRNKLMKFKWAEDPLDIAPIRRALLWGWMINKGNIRYRRGGKYQRTRARCSHSRVTEPGVCSTEIHQLRIHARSLKLHELWHVCMYFYCFSCPEKIILLPAVKKSMPSMSIHKTRTGERGGANTLEKINNELH